MRRIVSSVLCAGGVVAGLAGCSPSTAAAPGQVAVSPEVLDFGTVESAPIPFHRERVRVHNGTSSSLVVSNVDTTDGLRVELAHGRLVPAGKDAEIVITLDARERPGAYAGEVSIAWDGRDERLVIPVRAVVRETEVAKLEGPNAVIVGAHDWNFGKLQRQAIEYYDFAIRNDGTAPLVLESVETYCGCVQAWANEREIPPGETVAIHARVTPAVYPGNKPRKTITVTTNDPDTPVITYFVHGEILDSFTIEPSLVDFGVVQPGERAEMDVVIRAGNPALGRARELTLDSDVVAVERRPEAEGDGVVAAATLSIRPDAPRGPFDLRLLASFDAEGIADASVPIRGTVGVALPVAPTAVNFGLVRERAVYTRTLLVADVPNPQTLRVDCQLNFLTAEVVKDGGGARINLTYAPTQGMGEVRGQIVMEDTATGRVRTVPVVVQFERASVGA